jgi:acetyl-CoA C-acetyltransferase|uniref:thiolase family protein n=1 Tax=Cephaloticoccus sp. TaxID=1985742 RepID=UPI00404B678A
MTDIVILAATRTPIGNFQGAFASTPASELGATAIRGAVVQAGVTADKITDVLMGNVLQAGQGQAPTRQAAIQAGLSKAVRTATIHKVCGSGLQAVMQGAHALQAGMGSLFVAGGMENMTRAPYLLPKAREGFRIGHQQVIDSVISDGLWDPYNDIHMGSCAEQCATKYNFSREAQDAYAIESFKRANAAQQSGRFAREITPVEITDRKGNTTKVEIDEGPAKVNYDKIPQLKPAFQKDGTITPANASSINDGAAALVLCTADYAQENSHQPVARIVSFGAHAQEPLWFTTAPVQATRQALSAAGWPVGDVDLWEVNEAFAVVPMAFMHELNVSPDRLNVDGGAISLGHPIGCSGARIVVTLIAALKARGLKRGVAAICIGGGEGLAVCVELC